MAHHVFINAFLSDNGLGEHIKAFQDACFDDLEAFYAVSDSDLKELGLPLGHRKKLLLRLQKLQKPEAAEVLQPPATPQEQPAPLAPVQLDAIPQTTEDIKAAVDKGITPKQLLDKGVSLVER